VIVDQLSLAFPDGGTFVQSATRMLERVGYEVEYVGGEDVTVDVYRELPERGDDLVILRVHNAFGQAQGYVQGFVGLFTGERYGVRGHDEPGLGVVTTSGAADEWYYGVGPEFVESAMEGSFDGALVVMMGCNGLETSTTAEAFLDRGARAVVGWSDYVSLEHTDAATERLLEKLLGEGRSPERAVAEAKAELGPDPYFGAELRLLAR
jgi:hypothetical protein